MKPQLLVELLVLLCQTSMAFSLRMMSTDRYIAPSIEERIRKGTITANELSRVFEPTKKDMDAFARTKYEGVLGAIFSLEGVLVDLREVYKYSYAILAEDLREQPPSEAQVNDVIGIPFADALLALQWGVPKESVAAVEGRFVRILDKILEALPVRLFEGAESLADALIRAGDQVLVNTYLSRELAIKAIGKSGLSDTLEGRVGGDRLVFPAPEYPLTFRGQQLVRCCATLRKPPILVVSVDSNSRTILDAKRDGFSSVAVKGLTANAYQLRSADQVFEKLSLVKPKDLYHLVERRVKQEEGPQQQADSAPAMDKIRTKSVSAPALFEDDRPKDTFADEKGSDSM